MKQLRLAFLTGILVLVPLMITIDILRWLVQSIDRSVRQYLPNMMLPFDFGGLGVLFALILILVVGFLTQNFIGEWFVRTLDGWIRRIPLGGGLYSSIKKFLETIVNPRSDRFKGVVLVQFPRSGIYSIGFRTGIPDSHLSRKISNPVVNVFVPCTPNPTSGFYILVLEEELIPLDISVQEAFKIVISMGIVTTEEKSLNG